MTRLFYGIATLMLSLLLLQLYGCTDEKKQPVGRSREKITFCQGGHMVLLTKTALERGYFEEEGVEAVLMQLGDGKSAMEGLLAGDCEFGIMGEPPVVKQAFGRDDFAVIASVANSTSFTKILARKDRGISFGKDLKGKRIGVKKGVNSHTFLDLYLKKQAIKPEEVSLQFMELKDMPSALMTGDIDAYSSSDMYLLEGKRLLGDRAQVLSEPGFYLANSYLVAKRDFLAARQDTVRRVLRSLLKAENSIKSQPVEAGKLIAGTWKVSAADAENLLKDQNHVLSLGRKQQDSLAMHARWMLDAGVVEKKPLPDFGRLLDLAPLASVKPGSTDNGK